MRCKYLKIEGYRPILVPYKIIYTIYIYRSNILQFELYNVNEREEDVN